MSIVYISLLGIGGSKISAWNMHTIYLQQYSYFSFQYCYTLIIPQLAILIKNNEMNLPFMKILVNVNIFIILTKYSLY